MTTLLPTDLLRRPGPPRALRSDAVEVGDARQLALNSNSVTGLRRICPLLANLLLRI